MLLYHHCLLRFSCCNVNKLKFGSPVFRTIYISKVFNVCSKNNCAKRNNFIPFQSTNRNVHGKIRLKGINNDVSYASKDVPIYYYNNTKFFKYLSLFSVSQFIFWSYLSHVAYTTMRDTPVTKEELDAANQGGMAKFVPVGRRINLGRYKNGISIFCATVGFLSVVLTTLLMKNCARTILLKKGGENLVFEFFSLYGKGKTKIVPVANISALNSRRNAKSYLILKVKDRPLHVILDTRGTFPNTPLFDNTAGLRRAWSK